jgi:hypothetical protein
MLRSPTTLLARFAWVDANSQRTRKRVQTFALSANFVKEVTSFSSVADTKVAFGHPLVTFRATKLKSERGVGLTDLAASSVQSRPLGSTPRSD